MSGGRWLRVSTNRRCPVCDHADWCLVSEDGTAAICPRTKSDKRVGDAGWLHRLGHDSNRPPPCMTVKIDCQRVSPREVAALARRCQRAAERAGKLEEFADRLGLSVESLRSFGVGWLKRQRCSTWPMVDARGTLVGINRRFYNGAKRVIRGHRAGLYVPADLPLDLSGSTLLICEGGTDAIAARELGFAAVGRFSCTHGARMLVRLVRHRQPGMVVVIADRDGPGRRGAERLASALLPYTGCLKSIHPPPPHKDLRAWRLAGARRHDAYQLIETAPVRRLKVRVRTA